MEPIERISDIHISGMPLYGNPQISVTITDTGGTAKCGALVIGQTKEVGATQYGAQIGIIDYSRKETDEFGNTTIVVRDFSKRATFTVIVDKTKVDALDKLLASYRAIPIVYIGSSLYGSMIVFGGYKDWTITVSLANHSYLNIEIEGLNAVSN